MNKQLDKWDNYLDRRDSYLDKTDSEKNKNNQCPAGLKHFKTQPPRLAVKAVAFQEKTRASKEGLHRTED